MINPLLWQWRAVQMKETQKWRLLDWLNIELEERMLTARSARVLCRGKHWLPDRASLTDVSLLEANATHSYFTPSLLHERLTQAVVVATH